MPVISRDGVILLSGECLVEEAETLLGLIEARPGQQADLSDATHLHAAVFQALLASDVSIVGLPEDPFLRTWLAPLITEARRV